ncbi:MAG TPA: M4 family metallopeptidase [Bacteroidales bacterium]|nr:M4 family metallopeptidase [Bacteroidales bacterium]
MKKILLLFSVILISVSVFAQTYTGSSARAIVPGAEMVVKDTQLDIPTFIRFAKVSEPEFKDPQLWLEDHFKIGSDLNLKLIHSEKDDLGFTHYRYQQTYKGYPIHSNVFIVHVRNNRIFSMNGQLFSKLNVPANAMLTEAQALDKALVYVAAETYKWQIPGEEKLLKYIMNDDKATYFPKGTLVMIPAEHLFKGDNYRLAYQFDIYAHQPMSRQWVFVDAATGQVVHTLQRIHSENHDAQSVATGTAATKYSNTRTIITDYTGTTYRLRDATRGLGIETYDMNTGTSYTSAVDFTDADNNWTGTNTAQDEVARDAHWGTETTYDYFYTKHGRNSINNAGLKLLSYVHYDVDYANAFWDGTRMTYGDGDNTYSPLTTLDICAHEITHGLTEYTANLNYSYESGALNEGFSDIFGTSTEFYGKPTSQTGNWTVGEEIGAPFRSMSNPNLYGQPDTYLGTDWYTGTGDNGGVHYNSGVINFWYYLLCQGGSGTNDNGNAYNVTAITMAKAEKIAFRALTVYLTSSSQYAQARTYTIQACADLYGGCSQEMISVTNAWYAVGVGAAYSSSAVDADFTACPAAQCTAAPFTVQFTNQSTNGNTYLWSFGDGSTSTASAPSHTYTGNGAYNVKLVAYGGTCGSDSITKTGFITVGPSYPCEVALPASGTGTTQTNCTGKLYDSGLCSDYGNLTDGTITIAPTGASSVTLTFSTFDFEANYDYLYVYNGPTTASAQVAGSPFSGTTIPGPVTSSGGAITIRQYSDTYVVGSGFSLQWTCTSSAAPPDANFVANVTSSCTGTINFTDQSTNTPASWLWNFGDGQTSTLQNPSHTYSTNGTFTVKLRVTNQYGADSLIRTDYITIDMPDGPTATGATVCQGTAAQLTASGNGTLNWFDSPTSNTSLYTGGTYTTPVLNTTTNYYVQSTAGGSAYTGLTNKVNTTASNISAEQGLIFTALQPFVLKSVKVYSVSTGATSKTVTLKNSSGATLSTITANNVPNGESRITLNFNVPAGTNLRLTAPANSYLFRDNNLPTSTFPITLPDVLSITSTTAGSNPQTYYYYFYDWEVELPSCNSLRTQVTATVIPSPIAQFTYSQNGAVINFTNTSANGVSHSWDFGDGTNSTATNPSHTYAANGNYNVRLISSNSCSTDTTYQNIIISSLVTRFNISGKTRYAGKATAGYPAPNPPVYSPVKYNISQVVVILRNYPAGTELARDTSDALGNYQFTDVMDGNYILSYDKYNADTMQWCNNVNIIDLANVKYLITSDTNNDPSANFSAICKKAANVDNSAAINAIDATRIKAKIGSPYQPNKNFPKGNWVSLDTLISVSGSDLNIGLKTICYGDYNASSSAYLDSATTWASTKSIPGNIIVRSEESVTANDNRYFEVPLRISTKMNEFSALELKLNYPETEYELVNVTLPKAMKKSGQLKINPTLEELMANDDDLLVTAENGVIRVVYVTTQYYDVAANDVLIILGFRPLNNISPGMFDPDLSGTGIMANRYAEAYEDAYLLMPKIFIQGDMTDAGFRFTAFPNPFFSEATLTYNLPENGSVKLMVYNSIGELVGELVNEPQVSGKHMIDFPSNGLPRGMYTFKLEFSGQHSSKCLTLKMMH